MRILIADDHEVVRIGLRDLIVQHDGWEVCAEASNGVEAAELALRMVPDVAVLDVDMPIVDGIEATRSILGALPGTKVILYTLHDSEDIVMLGREAGVCSCVAKSGSAGELVSAIETASRLPQPCSRRAGGAGHGVGASTLAAPLTARQYELVRLIADGKRNIEAAEILGISVRTVETHRSNVMRRLRLHSTVELVRYAVRNHIIAA